MTENAQMTENTQMVPVQRAEGPLQPFSSEATPAAEKPTEKIRRLLRGRLRWALLLAVVLGGAGAGLGYLTPKPVYQGTGLVQINPTAPVLFSRTGEQTSVLPMYNEYMATQVSRIRGPRVVNLAMESSAWGAVASASSNPNIGAFTRELQVAVKGQVLIITYTDRDPDAARAGVQAVVEAYRKVHQDEDVADGETQIEKVEERRRQLEVERNRIRGQITEEKKRQGIDDIELAYELARLKLNRLQMLLDDVQYQLAPYVTADAAGSATKPSTQAAATTEPATSEPSTQPTTGPSTRPTAHQLMERLARFDYTAKALFGEWVDVERRIGVTAIKFGPEHPVRLALDEELRRVERRVTEFLENPPAIPEGKLDGTKPDPPTRPKLTAADVAELRERTRYLQAQVSESDRLARQYATAAMYIRQWGREEKELEPKLQELLDSIQIKRLQRSVSGRLVVHSQGEGAVDLIKDRRMSMGVLGGLGGTSMAFLIMMLIGSFDRRWHSPEDARMRMGGAMMLGILPNLPDDLGDPEQAAAASHAVHHIRSLLQIRASGEQAQALAITSPAAGTGKTSLALALGVSFASASSRTLLIDCDLGSGGLTSRVRAIVRRKIGQVLHRQGLITPQQLEEALQKSQAAAKPVGEVLVELGYVAAADLQNALLMQQQNRVGLLDALTGEDLGACIADTGIADLWILPLGGATARNASRLSPAALERLITQARSQFDVILLDTGPIPGSIEAAQVAAAADGVVLIVSRGEHRMLAEHCLENLHSVHARIAGVVFNRADLDDVILQASAMRSTPEPAMEDAPGAAPFGPMASAVAGGTQRSEAPGKDRSRPGQ